MFDVQFARRQMIEQQVPREEYVPGPYREMAFADTAVPLGHDQSMLPPKLEGRILQALEIQPHEHALEVGTGSGFFAACIGRLARSVRTIDLFADFTGAARTAFQRTGTHNVVAATADAMQLAEREAYDVIAVTGSLPVYVDRFEQALRIGGRLFVAVGRGPLLEALRVTRTGPSDWSRETLFETGMPALINAPEPSRFVF